MKLHGRDRGGVTLAVVAPILAAVIGGAAAVGAAFQIVNLAPSNADPGPAATQLSNSEVQYGGR
jgi:hypothetical protein